MNASTQPAPSHKFALLFLGVTLSSLTLSSATLGAIALAFPAQAKTAPPTHLAQAGRSTPAEAAPQRLRQILAELNLSEQQKTQLRQLSQQSRSQMQALLTPAQRQTLETAQRLGQSPRAAFQALNLSAQQKNQLQQLTQTRRQQIQQLLTPDQKKILRDRLNDLAGPNTPTT